MSCFAPTASAAPTLCTDVSCFAGLANHNRKLGLRLSAAPLTALCSPRATFTWGPQQGFDALKAAPTLATVLCVKEPGRPTRLLTEASELAVSAILEQPDYAGAFHPVAFESRKYTGPGGAGARTSPTRRSCWRWCTPSRRCGPTHSTSPSSHTSPDGGQAVL